LVYYLNMDSELGKARARRIKRLAWSRPHQFLAVCQPGLESLCARELSALGVGEFSPINGGVAFSAPLEMIYKLHLHSRLAGRFWLRLKQFRVRNLDDFKSKLGAIAWDVFLPQDAAVKLEASLGQSHLRHSQALLAHLRTAIDSQRQAHGLQPVSYTQESPLRVFLRTQKGQCSVSLDLSGPHLHKRGYRLFTGKAPLRETVAAALLAFCGYNGQTPFLDPMCGSGVLALEAAQIARRCPPGLDRQFNLNSLPCHRPAAWEYLRSQALAAILPALPQPVWGQDRAAMDMARRNSQIYEQLRQMELGVQWRQADFWSAPPPAARGLLAINPPYGVRLGSVRQAKTLALRLGAHLRKNFCAWQVGVLLYRPEWQNFFRLARPQTQSVAWGGLRLTMLSGRQLP
jgi:putative N6-adenine-specific DNA methylase